MKARILVLAALAAVAIAAPRAEARNFHVAGGIQYVVQAGQEAAKGEDHKVDAQRLYGKAVAQLTQGLGEDPNDLEAYDYLGVAYAELDSLEQAGRAFSTGIQKACPIEDKKKLCARLKDNREHYWVLAFNKAINTYKAAVGSVPEGKQPDPSTLMPAIMHMKQAVAVNPDNPTTYCNLAAFQANAGQIEDAIATIDRGLQIAPNDSCLMLRKEAIGVNTAVKAAESGNFGPAIAAFEKTLAANPKDAGTALNLGEIYFKQGSQQESAADKETDAAKKKELMGQAKTSFEGAVKGYGKYHELKPDDKDGLYNLTLATLRAGDPAGAAKLAEEGLAADGAAAEYHSLLASAYRDLKVDDAAAAHTLVSRALKEGNKEEAGAFSEKAVAQFGATSDPAKRVKELGAPDEIRTMTMGEYPVETWLWYGKKRAILFSKGKTVTAADWNAVAVAAAEPKAPAGKKTR